MVLREWNALSRIAGRVLLAALAGCSVAAWAQGAAGPVPAGKVLAMTLAAGRQYPGTPHNYSIYVPAGYDGTKAMPYTVFLDGSMFLHEPIGAAAVLDRLIAEHAIPPMIGIFVDPGVLPAISADARSRYERSFEYDSLSDRYSKFLLEELIPAVGARYKLSASADDHGIAGISTGAVGAFVAAWNRPDAFHRVGSFIGTYVAMRGADSLPALVRKTEPKPLRIYLEDGANDHIVPGEPYGTFFAGNWPINNEVMYEDLEFGGYDAKLTIGQGGHDMKGGVVTVGDAMRWLWRGYPEPVVPHPPEALGHAGWDTRGSVFATVFAGESWQRVGEGMVDAFGVAPSGDVIVADAKSGGIAWVGFDGHVQEIARDGNDPRALTVGADGTVFVYEKARRRIVAYRGAKAANVAEDVDVAEMAVTRKGTLYFSDPVRGRIGRLNVAARTAVAYTRVAMGSPAGVTLSPDQAMLLVADAEGRYSWSFQLAADGELQDGEPFYRLEVPDAGWQSKVLGVGEDSTGQVYFGTALGVQVCEANGRVAEILNGPESGGVSSLRFAGPQYDWLYAIHDGRLYRRHMRVAGVPVTTPKKLPEPPL